MEREALTLEALSIAMAAHNSGGIVIVQVERLAENGSLNPRQVKIPGVLVDCVVRRRTARVPPADLSPRRTAPAYAGEIRVPPATAVPQAMNARKIIARRAAFELRPNSVVNLGIGMPEGVAAVADEERVIDLFTLTAEPGVIGGIPAGGLELRRRGQHAGDHRPALPVRLLRRRRARPGGPRPGAGRRRRQPQRQPLRAAAGRRRRLHQHQPERRKVVFAGTFMAGDGGIAVERRPAAPARRDGRLAQVRRRGRAAHLLRPRGAVARPAGALRHRALRVPAASAAGWSWSSWRPGSTSSATCWRTWASRR